MRQLSTTSLGRRAISAGLMASETAAASPASSITVDKWAILQDLTDGREAFGLTDRNLSVLSALLSFYPARELSGGVLTVFPSNSSLSGRLHGMPESTLRRHVAALVDAGMIRRHDSPNGKRYATRDGRGRIDRVFGFDLTPLLLRAAEINDAATAARDTSRMIRRTRQTIALLMRDAMQLLNHAENVANQDNGARPDMAEMHRALRRKLDLTALSEIEAALRKLLGDRHGCRQTPRMSGNDSQNERHQQKTDSDHLESEETKTEEYAGDDLPLAVVLKAAPEISTYAETPVRDWHDLIRITDFLHPMLGVTREIWQLAQRNLGRSNAAIALACMLQKFSSIRTPGAYLRKLATTDNFRVGPMVKALLRRDDLARGSC